MQKQRGGYPSLIEYALLVVIASLGYLVANSIHVLWR